jgi:hypothetical protein
VLWGFTAVPQAGLNALYFNNLFTYYDSIIAQNGQLVKQYKVSWMLKGLLLDTSTKSSYNKSIRTVGGGRRSWLLLK